MANTTTLNEPSFAELFEQCESTKALNPGELIVGLVVHVGHDVVIVDTGLKSEGAIPIEQFRDADGLIEVKVGDQIEVCLESVEDGTGETRLSREKARRAKVWVDLEKAFEDKAIVKGVMTGKVKGGFTVVIDNIRAFLPGSLVDTRPLRDTTHLEGKELEFRIIKIDRKRNNVVVSRRSVIETGASVDRGALLESIEEGAIITGTVKNLTDYGAFIDLGGIDGLLHITDISWKRVKHPSEALTPGDEVQVQVLKFDRERERISLGLKQLADDPWKDLARRYPESARVFGRVTNITDYGAFVEIEDGVEGLVHVSEIDWVNKNVHPNKLVHVGQEVEVMVLDLDEERRRISLGIKQCQPNPWEDFAGSHQKGDRITGQIRSLTDFGIFIGLDGGIDGLIHLSDLSWDKPGEEAVREYKKGDMVEALVLSIDAERERISLGIKQLAEDPFSRFAGLHDKGSVVSGEVTMIDAKGAEIRLADGVDGYLPAREMSRDKVEDARTLFKVGDRVETLIANMDRKNRSISLTIKGREARDEKDAVAQYKGGGSAGTTNLGDLLKEQMKRKQEEQEIDA